MKAEYFLGSTKLHGQFWYETRVFQSPRSRSPEQDKVPGIDLAHNSSENSLNKSVPHASELEDSDNPDGVHDAQAARVVNWTTRETIAGASVDAVRQRVVDERQAREAARCERDARRGPVLVPQVR